MKTFNYRIYKLYAASGCLLGQDINVINFEKTTGGLHNKGDYSFIKEMKDINVLNSITIVKYVWNQKDREEQDE